jgi:hypothetical protein
MKFFVAALALSSVTAFAPSVVGGRSSAVVLSATVEASSTKALIPPALSEKDIEGLYKENVQTTYGYVRSFLL